MSESCFYCKKPPNLIKKYVSLLCVKTKSGAHKQPTYNFQMRKHFCSHLHSSLISMSITKNAVFNKKNTGFGFFKYIFEIWQIQICTICIKIVFTKLRDKTQNYLCIIVKGPMLQNFLRPQVTKVRKLRKFVSYGRKKFRNNIVKHVQSRCPSRNRLPLRRERPRLLRSCTDGRNRGRPNFADAEKKTSRRS